MKTTNKKRIIIGVIVLLLLINISAIITIGYNKYERNNIDKEYTAIKKEKRSPHKRMKLYVKKELELNDIQYNNYCGLKDENLKNSDKFISKIRVYKKQTIIEINKKQPDSLILIKFSDSIGQQHKLLQLEMNRHFLAIKQILEPDQVIKLEKLLNRMDERYRPRRRKKHKQQEGKGSCNKKNRHRYRH